VDVDMDVAVDVDADVNIDIDVDVAGARGVRVGVRKELKSEFVRERGRACLGEDTCTDVGEGESKSEDEEAAAEECGAGVER
jgi:hypothetical protein